MNTNRYFIELSYDGTDFHGWQTQPNALTVQECLNKALCTVFRQEIETLGCGRTDAGVHATQFFAHFDVAGEPSEIMKTGSNINALLPYTIAVKRIIPVEKEAHARFDATSRTYQYFIHFAKNPFKLNRSWLVKDVLDIEKMQIAADVLPHHTDFSCFSKSNTQTFTNNCKIESATVTQTEDGLVFEIKADRFLRNMVRAIVGTLVNVGKSEMAPEALHEIIESKNRSMAGQSVPACGLYLVNIKYPYINN